MKTTLPFSFSLALVAGVALATPALAVVDIDYVIVGNAGNAADPGTDSLYGAVAYGYKIAKNETTISQYAEFLNAVAKTDTYSLYNTNMTASDINGISRSGSPGSFTYSVTAGSGNKPITYASWFDAARFANWMHNGQPVGAQTDATTEDGAYTLNGAISGVSVSKNAGATVWIPSENEWYKAAYYDPNKGGAGVGGYWLHANRSNTMTSNTVGTAGAANYWDGDYVGSGNSSYSTVNALTNVGAYGLNSASAYGTNDQAGNVGEWTDAVISTIREDYRFENGEMIPYSYPYTARVLRGGVWHFDEPGLRASRRSDMSPGTEANFTGFRVASGSPAPEIEVSHSGLDLPDGGGQSLGVASGARSSSLTFVIRNSGGSPLTDLGIEIDGPDAAMFAVTTQPVAPVEGPSGTTTFTVRFEPAGSGNKTAELRITSNDSDENPFNLTLSGTGLSLTQDTDGDGLSDAMEFQMELLGFDWQNSQLAMVGVFVANSGYTTDQIQAMNVDVPLLSKDPTSGLFKLTMGLRKSTDLKNFTPLPMTSSQISINTDGKLEFHFASPDNAAFYRIEVK